jgi:hypothetical protein
MTAKPKDVKWLWMGLTSKKFESEYQLQFQARGSGKTTQLEEKKRRIIEGIEENMRKGSVFIDSPKMSRVGSHPEMIHVLEPKIHPTILAMDDHLATVTTDPKDMMIIADPSKNKDNFVVMTMKDGTEFKGFVSGYEMTAEKGHSIKEKLQLKFAKHVCGECIFCINNGGNPSCQKYGGAISFDHRACLDFQFPDSCLFHDGKIHDPEVLRAKDFQQYLTEVKHAGFLSARLSYRITEIGFGLRYFNYFCQHCQYNNTLTEEKCTLCIAFENWTPYTGLCDKCMNHHPDNESCGFCQECLRGEDADAH